VVKVALVLMISPLFVGFTAHRSPPGQWRDVRG
jgi:hypothetical protein